MRPSITTLALVPLIVALILPGPGSAQLPLDRVERLISEGEAADARSALESWWDEERPDAPLQDRQRGLWLRGRLTLEGERAALDFRRLVIEHPGSPYSADALLRLGHGAHMEGDLKEAAEYFQTLVRDYPGSPLRLEARSWLGRFGQETARAEAAPKEAVPAEEDREEGREAAPTEDLPYAVQLGAFSSERRARRLWEQARSADLDPRLIRIPGSGLIRVRVGAFPDSPGAEGVLQRVRNLGFEATIVTDALKEEPLR